LILVDTKYEFGLRNGELILIDEIHTPDSSRYFIAEGYEERQENGEQQQQLSKEFVREWLIENDFMGLENQEVPHIPDEFVQTVSKRYIQLYEQVTGMQFEINHSTDPVADVSLAVEQWIQLNR
jgi:phosphoribosylaminoimidazole-succinocarboxamide synthase